MIRGAIGFALVSTAAFAVWAFGGGWFHSHGGEAALYASCAAAFILLSGMILRRLLAWPGTFLQFYRFFLIAFLAYAVVWCAAWFSLGAGKGEWLASFAGSVVFTAVMAATLRAWRAWVPSALVMFGLHSAGYFAGEQVCYASLHSTESELAWGTLYGLGFGAGMGFALAMMQPSSWKPAAS